MEHTKETAADFLDQKTNAHNGAKVHKQTGSGHIHFSDIPSIMEEYAQLKAEQQAILFGSWLAKKVYKWSKEGNMDEYPITTSNEELYQLFLKYQEGLINKT